MKKYFLSFDVLLIYSVGKEIKKNGKKLRDEHFLQSLYSFRKWIDIHKNENSLIFF